MGPAVCLAESGTIRNIVAESDTIRIIAPDEQSDLPSAAKLRSLVWGAKLASKELW